jgi:hypothetical protein
MHAHAAYVQGSPEDEAIAVHSQATQILGRSLQQPRTQVPLEVQRVNSHKSEDIEHGYR